MSKLYTPLNIQRFAAILSISSSVTSQDTINNVSYVNVTVTITRSANTSTFWESPNYRTLTITCDGQTYSVNTLFPRSNTSVTYSHEFVIGHNGDGTKSIGYSAVLPRYSSSLPEVSTSGSATLPTIPRGFSGGIGLTVASMTETSVTFNWSTTETCNWVRYHFDGSAGWHDVFGDSATSGSFTVYNGDSLYGGGTGTVSISAASSHSVYIECRRQDSGIWSNSGAVPFTTYDYPKPVSVSSGAIDNGFTVNVNNPLRRTYTLTLISNVDESACAVYTGNINGNVSGFNNEAAINNFYATIPNSPSGTYYAKVTCAETSTIKTVGNGTYSAANNDATKPEMSIVGYEDSNATTLALTGDDQKLITGYSTIKVTIPANNKATPHRYASIKGYFLKNGANQTALVNEVEGEDVELEITATSGIIEVWAVDTRDLSNVYQITNTTMVNYTPIQKNQSPLAQRTDEHRTPNGVGEYVNISLGGTYWNNNFGSVTNAIQSISYNYANAKTPSQTTPGTTTITASTSNEYYDIDQLILGDTERGFDVSNSYIINVTVADKLSQTTFAITLSSGTPHIAFSPNGVSIMGKYNEEVGGLFQVGGQAFTGGDTLPINSIFDYDGSTVPDGYEEVDDYSTDEVVTGKLWINGKPIYRKVIYISALPNAAQQGYNTGISNVDFVLYCMGYTSSGMGMNTVRPLTTSGADFGCWYDISSNQIKIETGQNRSNLSGYVIVEYTKTTD